MGWGKKQTQYGHYKFRKKELQIEMVQQWQQLKVTLVFYRNHCV